VPVLWAVVAALNAVGGDPARHQLEFTLQNAGRFVYVLLYFPVVDLIRADRGLVKAIWLVPALAICLLTIGIWVVEDLIQGETDGRARLLFLSGRFGPAEEGFRVFFGNQLMLIPAFGLLLAQLAAEGKRRIQLIGLALVLITAYLSHTRGVWLGLSVLCAAMVVALLLRSAKPALRPPLIAVSIAGALAILAVSSLLLSGSVGRPGFLNDESTRQRVEQADPLWSGFTSHPVLGNGLGAALPSGFERSQDFPWSFELTYLQILFQMGVVGLLAVLWLPARGIWFAGRELIDSERIRAGPLAGLGGLAGILACTATNPLLLTSVGMLALVMAISLIEPPPARPGGPAP
jgi:O-antigen ligase